MECPKCGLEIDDNAITCPNCKKVLKLVCPVCKKINETNTCQKCGYVIVTKCNNCGKIAPVEKKFCPKCNFSLEKSVILNESNTDDFAMLTIDFPNLSEIQRIFANPKLYNKFKNKLDSVINGYLSSIKIRRQIIGKTCVIRFNKDYSFTSSVNTAINSAIQILNLITRLNCKLTQKHNTSVKCNMFLMKRTTQDDPNNYDSGFNLNLLNVAKNNKSGKVLNAFQVLTDSNIFDAVNNNYKFEQLNYSLSDGQVKMVYELDIKDEVVIDESLLIDEEENDEIEVPNFVQNMLIEQDKIDGEVLQKAETPKDTDAIYDLETLNFEEIRCEFLRIENVDVFYHLVNKFQEIPQGIIAIKSAQMYVPYSLKIINEIEKLHIYKNIISVTCYDEMKYSPYSFFRELISAIFEYTVSQKLFSKNDFSAFSSIDPKHLIKDLISMSDRELQDVLETRNEYFDIFLTLLQVVPNTLIFVENFEKADSGSFEVLKYLFEEFEKLQISYLLTFDKQFSLHKKIHSLLTKPYYTEITLKPTPFEKLIEENKYFYKDILNDFYFHRIAKYSCGSILFLDIAIQYLVESGVYQYSEDAIQMVNPKTIIIPSNLNKLMQRRLNLLKDDPDALKFLTTVVLLGTRVDMATIDSLGYQNSEEIISKLSDMGYVYFYNNCLYFPNYNLLRNCLLAVVEKIDLQDITNYILENILTSDNPVYVKPYLYRLLGDKQNEFLQWKKLAKVDLALGDFSAYLNCATEILKLLETQENLVENIEEYKLNLYETIADNLYVYIPVKTQGLAEETLKNLEQTTDIEKIIRLCNKMIYGAMQSGQYTHALTLTHKILSLIPNASISPEAPNFNKYFFLMALIHVEILFNLGAMQDCMEIGYQVLNVINNYNIDKVIPDYMSEDQLKEMIADCVGYVALAGIIQLTGNVKEFLDAVYSSLNFIPSSYNIFIDLENFISGKNNTIAGNVGDDKFSPIIHTILKAFNNLNDASNFAEEIYQAKIYAHDNKIAQLEIFCDLLIAYAYINLSFYEKAESIINNIINATQANGMFVLEYLGYYLISEINIRNEKFDVAYGILNNSIIKLERNGKVSEYIMMLFKYSMYKALMNLGEINGAEVCIQQAVAISKRYGINFNFEQVEAHEPKTIENEGDN